MSLTRPHQSHSMPPGGQTIHKTAQGHGDSVDFRCVCFRDERDMHVGFWSFENLLRIIFTLECDRFQNL